MNGPRAHHEDRKDREDHKALCDLGDLRDLRDEPSAVFAADVQRDLALAPKQLQSKYLYDPLGSSLFEAICRLPWYRITRAERALLDRHAPEIVARLCVDEGAVPLVVELGCGSGEKIVILAEALQAAGGHGRVHLIDISSQALEQSERTLGRLNHISVVGHRETYEVGLRRAAATRDGDDPMLVLLLGSNIGNLPSIATSWCGSTVSLAGRSTWTPSHTSPYGIPRTAGLRCTWRAAPINR